MTKHGLIFSLVISLMALGGVRDVQAATYTLTITANHGSVRISPEKELYDEGETVELIPRPDVGYCFNGWTGDVVTKRLVAEVTMDSNKSITANFGTWQPPIGIPTPSFGIRETYRMYDDPGVRNEALTYVKNAEGGYYTHYVDSSDPNASDTSNTYGTATKPRRTVPNTLPAGSVVEIHNSIDETGTRYKVIQGTAELPVFVRGYSPNEPPEVAASFVVKGPYTVWENLKVKGSVQIRPHDGSHAYYVCVRNCELWNIGEVGAGAGVQIWGASGSLFHDIVVYGNHIHHGGDSEATQENDNHGIAVGSYVEDLWVLDNHVHHMGGDSVQVSHGANYTTQRVYIGRNVFHDDRENAVDIKQANHIVVSENEMFAYEPCSSAPGEAAVVHYDPHDIYWLCNRIHESRFGIVSTGCSEQYIIGNVIHNISGSDDYSYPYSPHRSGIGVRWYNTGTTYVANNTIYNCEMGIGADLLSYTTTIVNNIICDANDADGYCISIQGKGTAGSTMTNNVLYQAGRSISTYWGGAYEGLTAFQIATGKGEDCFEASPLFVDADTHSFRLRGLSSAIDAGTSSGVVAEVFDRFEELYGIDIRKDIQGRPRPQGAGWDIGAYEYALGAIVDLASSGASQNSLTFAWTVPGADGSSDQPGRYDIRYAQTAISEANWEAATQVQGEPVPGEVGEAESFTLTGLAPGTTYYVAIKTSNDRGSTVSALSNVASATTATSGNRAPVLNSIGNRSVAENEVLSFTISAADADGDTLTYTAVNVPAGATFTPATRTFAWTPTKTQSGTYWVTFQVSDGQVTVSETIAITVEAIINHAPVLSSIGDQSISEGTLLSLSAEATDGDGDPLSFSAAGLPPGANFADGAFSWVPTYEQAGSYTVTFTVSDGELTDSEEITIIVVNVVPDLTAPTANDIYPLADAIQIPLNALVKLSVADAGHGIDANTVIIRINDYTVYSGNSASYDSAYGTCCRTGTPASYSYSYQPDEDFDFDEQVTVYVTASDLAGNAMTALSYGFTTEMRAFGRNRTASWGPSDIDKGHPATGCDSNGNIWVVYEAGPIGQRDIYLSKMAADAENFAGPVQLTTNAGDQSHPSLAIGSDDKLYIVWQDNRQGNWDIYGRTSIDGVNWSVETQITESEDDQVAPVVAVDGQSPGMAWVAWQDDSAGHQDIYVANSSNAFLSNATARVTSNAADQIAPDIAINGANTVYLVWTDARNGSEDIYGADSEVGPWANVAVATGTGRQYSPCVATEATGTALHFAWGDDVSGDSDIHYAISDGMPSSPLVATSIIDDTSGAIQTAPTLAVTGSTGVGRNVFVCWQDGRNVTSGGIDTDLYFADVETGNETNVLVGDGGTRSSQSEPAIGVNGDGHPYVVWTDGRNVSVEIYYAGSSHTDSRELDSDTVTALAGGTVGVVSPAAEGDVSVVIPAGACSHDLVVTIAEVENPQFVLSSAVLVYEFGPSGLQFSVPVTITIPYAVADFPNGTPTPCWYDSQTGSLIQQGITDIESITISDTIRALRFKTTHFTPYALFDAVIDGGGDGGDGTSSSGGGGGGCTLSPTGDADLTGFLLPYLAVAMAMAVLRWRDRKAQHGTNR